MLRFVGADVSNRRLRIIMNNNVTAKFNPTSCRLPRKKLCRIKFEAVTWPYKDNPGPAAPYFIICVQNIVKGLIIIIM